MRPASDSILSAVERADLHEDRLTEVLACVAQVNARFAAALVRMAGLEPRPGERYAVGTQRGTPGGRRVDMEIATYDGLARTRLIWVEAKDGAAFSLDQLPDYAEQVRDPVSGHPDGRVLAIIPPGMTPLEATPGSAGWETKTWSDVALEAERLGRAWGRASGRPRWRRAAMVPEAPSQWRYLAELVQRLEEKEYARMQSLTAEDVIAAQRHTALGKTIEDLVNAAVQHIAGVEPSFKHRGIKRGRFHWLEPTEAKWFSDRERFGDAYAELAYYHHEDWTPKRLGAPAFCAGITFVQADKATRDALEDENWQASLPSDVTVGKSLTVAKSGKDIHLVRTKYLSELIVEGATFDEQALGLGLWANEAISDLMDQVSAPT